MSTQPQRNAFGVFANVIHGRACLGGRFLNYAAPFWKVKGSALGILAVALLVAIGSACGSDKKSEKATVYSAPTVAGQAKPATSTAKPADTPKPTNTPNPTGTPGTTPEATATAPLAATATTAAGSTSSPPPTNTTAPAQPATPTPRPPAATPAPPTVAPLPTATSASAGFSLPGCYVAGQDRCNCSHFSTQAYAQWFHNNYDLPDVNRLDSNKDGVVCESNR